MNMHCISPTVVLALAAVIGGSQSTPPPEAAPCRLGERVVRVRELPEASGVAASRRSPGLFWAHNDSAAPVLFALDSRGAVAGQVRVTGASVDDWEDIAVAPCGNASCIYIADIGDNEGERSRITVYRVPEPARGEAATAPADAFHATYPDGAHDAEALFIAPGGDVFIVTKGDPGPVALYRFPVPLKPGSTARLERVGEPWATGRVESHDRPTAADASSDGRWVAVRTTRYVAFFRAADLVGGRRREAFRADLKALREPRGEGITFASDGTLVVVGEAGPTGGRGTFGRISCTFEP